MLQCFCEWSVWLNDRLIWRGPGAGVQVPLRMSVDAISFSAHADYTQTSQFIAALAPPHVVLVRRLTDLHQHLRAPKLCKCGVVQALVRYGRL